MERKDLIAKNVEIMKAHGRALNNFSGPNVKVLVVANPANTNCLTVSTTTTTTTIATEGGLLVVLR